MKRVGKHWWSVSFAVISVAFVCLSYWGVEWWCMNVWLRRTLILGCLALFILVELLRCKGMVLLKFDRAISESSLSQCWSAVLLFLIVFDVLLAVQRQTPSQIFSDLVSPITLRNNAYPLPKDTITLTDSGVSVRDSLRMEIPVVSPAAENVGRHDGAIVPAVVYMLGLLVFSGVLVATLNRMFATRADRYRNGLTHYRIREHTVIIGAGDTAISVVNALLESRTPGFIVVMTQNDVVRFRKRLFSAVDEKYHGRLVVQYGDQTSSADLNRMCLDRVRQIFILGEDPYRGSATRDADNITTLELMKPMRQRCGKPINCYVRFDQESTFIAFRFSDFSDNIASVFNFIPFNLYQMMAQKILVGKTLDFPMDDICPLEGESIGYQSERTVHLVVVGMTQMGCTMAIEAARLCHYPNFLRNSEKRTRITFIDPQADTKMRSFMSQYRELFSVSPWRYCTADENNTNYYGFVNWESTPWHTMSEELYDPQLLGRSLVDVEWEFVKGGVEDASIQGYLRSRILKEPAALTVAVCWDDSHSNMNDALYLPSEVYNNGLQVLVYQPGNESAVKMLTTTVIRKNWSPRYKKLYSFGLVKEGMDLSQYEFPLALAVNYIYSSMTWNANGSVETADYKLDGVKEDSSVLVREWVKESQNGKSLASNRWSNICAAQSVWVKLRSIGWKEGEELSQKDEEILSMVEHYRWNMEQLIAGYRPVQRNDSPEYAVKRNGIHPCLKEYGLLSEDYKKIDLFFIKALPSLYALWKNGNGGENTNDNH